MSQEIQVPTAISGVVTKLPDTSLCMDGATHLMHSPTDLTRLKGHFADATAALDRVSDGKTKVTVMGYPVWGPECMHLSVYDVSEMQEVMKLFESGIDPWPWKSLMKR